MAIVEKSALVPYPAQAMFDLVADVESYKEFLPWCSNSRRLSSGDNETCIKGKFTDGGNTFTFFGCDSVNVIE